MSIYFKFPVSEKIEKRIDKVIADIEASDRPKSFSKDLSHIVNDLLDEGMVYFFVDSLKKINVNTMVRKPFELGISTSLRGLKMISPKIFKTLSDKQFDGAVEILKEMIHREDEY
jgi:hypothetical protein